MFRKETSITNVNLKKLKCGLEKNVVIQPCAILHPHNNFKICADHYTNFTILAELGTQCHDVYYVGATIDRQDWAGTQIDKELLKKGWGSFDLVVETIVNMAIMKLCAPSETHATNSMVSCQGKALQVHCLL